MVPTSKDIHKLIEGLCIRKLAVSINLTYQLDFEMEGQGLKLFEICPIRWHWIWRCSAIEVRMLESFLWLMLLWLDVDSPSTSTFQHLAPSTAGSSLLEQLFWVSTQCAKMLDKWADCTGLKWTSYLSMSGGNVKSVYEYIFMLYIFTMIRRSGCFSPHWVCV